MGVGGPDAELGALGKMRPGRPRLFLSVCLSRPIQGARNWRYLFSATSCYGCALAWGWEHAWDRAAVPGGRRANPISSGADAGVPGRDKPGASRARCEGRGGGSAPGTARGLVPGDLMGSREAGLVSPGAFPAVTGIWRLPARGERRCAVCSLLAGDVDFQGVATGDKQHCSPGWAADMSLLTRPPGEGV